MSKAPPPAEVSLDLLATAPLPLAVAALWAFALARGGVYYLIGRLSLGRPGSRIEGWAQRLTRGYVSVAQSRIERYGPRAIILTYPVYGLSAAVQVLSGGFRMQLVVFYLALAVVSLPWAVLQVVVGLTAVMAILTGHWPWVLGGAILVIGGWELWHRHYLRHRAVPDPPDDSTDGFGHASRP